MSDGMAGFAAGHMLTLNPAFYQVFISALFFLRFRLPVRFLCGAPVPDVQIECITCGIPGGRLYLWQCLRNLLFQPRNKDICFRITPVSEHSKVISLTACQ